MIFTIKDRLILLQILPTYGSLSEMVDVMDLAKELKLNDKEKQQINYNDKINNQILWDISKDPNKKNKS